MIPISRTNSIVFHHSQHDMMIYSDYNHCCHGVLFSLVLPTTTQQSAKVLFAEKIRAASLVMLAPMLGQYWPMLAPDPERGFDTAINFLTIVKNLTLFFYK